MTHSNHYQDPVYKANTAKVSMAVGFSLLVGKVVVGVASGSLGVMATAVDSAMDLLASTLVFFSIRMAHEGPDEHHDYGHGKAESLAALGQAALIALASVELVRRGVARLHQPAPIENFALAAGSTAVFAVATLALTLWLRRRAAESGSLALEGDSAHYASDMLGYVAVLAGLFYSRSAGSPVYDTIASLVIAGYLLFTAVNLARQSIDELMDKTLDEETTRRILDIITAHQEVRDHHLLKTRRSGPHIFVEFHAVLRPDMSFLESHRVVEHLQDQLEQAIPGCHATIHADPWDDSKADMARQRRVLR